MKFTFSLSIIGKIPSIPKFDNTPIIPKNVQSTYKGFSGGFQSYIRVSRHKVITKLLQSTLKALGGIGGVDMR